MLSHSFNLDSDDDDIVEIDSSVWYKAISASSGSGLSSAGPSSSAAGCQVIPENKVAAREVKSPEVPVRSSVNSADIEREVLTLPLPLPDTPHGPRLPVSHIPSRDAQPSGKMRGTRVSSSETSESSSSDESGPDERFTCPTRVTRMTPSVQTPSAVSILNRRSNQPMPRKVSNILSTEFDSDDIFNLTRSMNSKEVQQMLESLRSERGHPTHSKDIDSDDDMEDTTSCSESEHEFPSSTHQRPLSVPPIAKRRKIGHPIRAGPSPPSDSSRVAVADRKEKIMASACILPQVRFGRARRILAPDPSFTMDHPLVAVSMKGDVQFVSRETRRWFPQFSLPNSDNIPFNVEDACIVNDTIVLAYKQGPSPLSTIPLKATHLSAARPIISYSPAIRKPASGEYSRVPSVVRSLAPVPSSSSSKKRVITAGYDRTVCLWNLDEIAEGLEGNSDSDSETTAPIPLPFFEIGILPHKATALAVRDDNLFYSRGKVLGMANVSRLPNGPLSGQHVNGKKREPTFHKLANDIFHIHVPSDVAYQHLVITETDHDRTQIGIYDTRKDIRSTGEDVAFGYTTQYQSSKSSMSSRTSTRYFRGSPDTVSSGIYKFARGYSDGVVCLFDWRNAKEPAVVKKLSARRSTGSPVYHTIFADFCAPGGDTNGPVHGIVAFGEKEIDFMDLKLDVFS